VCHQSYSAPKLKYGILVASFAGQGKFMMRWVLLLIALFAMAAPAGAQRRPAGYRQAEQSFSQLTVDERIKQVSVLIRCE
jgi:hypothetical protein